MPNALPHLYAIAIAQIEKTTDEKITALAYEFHEALYKKRILIPLDIVEPLSLANFFGWMAYDIYDDALDGEDGAALIPCANFFLRALTEIYHSLGTRAVEIAPLFKGTMDRIDDANAWEQRHCRILAGSNALPSFGGHETLADRSIGHAIGPLPMLLLAGYDAERKGIQKRQIILPPLSHRAATPRRRARLGGGSSSRARKQHRRDRSWR